MSMIYTPLSFDAQKAILSLEEILKSNIDFPMILKLISKGFYFKFI
jgi:hypothetical protein